MVNEMIEYQKIKDMWERDQEFDASKTKEILYQELRKDFYLNDEILYIISSKDATPSEIIQALKRNEIMRLEREKKTLGRKLEQLKRQLGYEHLVGHEYLEDEHNEKNEIAELVKGYDRHKKLEHFFKNFQTRINSLFVKK